MSRAKGGAVIYLILPVFLSILFTSVCASAAVRPSSINVTVEASTVALAAIINQSLPKELYKGQGGMGTSVTVLRTAPVVVTAADGYVYLTLPVQLSFSYAIYESNPIRAQLRFKAKVDVAPDWRLKTELYYTGLSDSMAETFKIGPLSLKPKTMVENISQPVQKLLAPIVDQKVNQSLQLRAKVGALWQNAFAPKLVSKEFSAWLKLAPERIVMTPLSATNNRIQLSLGVVTGAEITIGPKPAPAPVKVLPPLQQFSSFDKGFNIQLATDIIFADLVNALKPVLLEKTFGDAKKITIKSFDLKAEEGRLVIVLTTTGDFDGQLTVFAKPVCSSAHSTLTFEDVDFDTERAGWLITTGSWLFSSPIRSTIKSKLDAAVVEQLEKARLKASSALSSVQIADHVKLTGAVRSLSLGDAIVLADRLSIQVIAQGETSVSLK